MYICIQKAKSVIFTSFMQETGIKANFVTYKNLNYNRFLVDLVDTKTCLYVRAGNHCRNICTHTNSTSTKSVCTQILTHKIWVYKKKLKLLS